MRPGYNLRVVKLGHGIVDHFDVPTSKSRVVTEMRKPKMVVSTPQGIHGFVDFPKASFDNLRNDAKIRVFDFSKTVAVFQKSDLSFVEELPVEL